MQASHPDQQQVVFVIHDIRHGFKLEFQSTHRLRRAKKNKSSAFQHAKMVDEYLANEVALGKVAGLFKSPPLPRLHISSFGLIPKKGQPRKWRLIALGGASVNDGIDPQLLKLQFITVDQTIRMVANYGPGALNAKFDVEAAYQNIAIHPDDGSCWARSGGVNFMWISPSPLVCAQHPSFSTKWQTWSNGFS